MGAQPKYKEPTIIRAKRGWFIALPYLNPNGQGYKRFELSGGINYIKIKIMRHTYILLLIFSLSIFSCSKDNIEQESEIVMLIDSKFIDTPLIFIQKKV